MYAIRSYYAHRNYAITAYVACGYSAIKDHGSLQVFARHIEHKIPQFAWRHMAITPAECISCRLCESSCPFEAIDKPTGKEKERTINQKKFIRYILMLPIFIVFGAVIGYLVHPALANAHPIRNNFV